MSSTSKFSGRGAFKGKFTKSQAKQNDSQDTSKIHAQVLKQARKSGQLNLSGRSLEVVPDSVWNVNLDLPEESKMASLDGSDDAWWEQVDLTKLILASNCLTELSDDIHKLPALTVLDVHDNRIEKISDRIGELLDIQRLVISHNKVSSLPVGVCNLTKLVALHLDNNQLTQLPEDIGSLVNLQDLNVSKNRLTALPPAVDWLRKVTNLNVSQNCLTEIPHEIGSLTCLKVLDASQNKITTIPNSLENLSRLEQLYLQQNKLTSIPLLTHCAVLKDVQLGDNCLKEVSGEHLKTFVSVSILDMRDNQLSVLPDEIGLLQALERLTLCNNHFSSLPYILGTLPNLKTLQLEGNPLRSIRRDIVMRGTNELKKYLRSRMSVNELQEEADKQSHSAPGVSSQEEMVELSRHDVHQLKSLDYSGKQTTAVPDSVWTEIGSVGITTVNLSKNKLHELPPGLMVVSDTLKDLRLGYNKMDSLSPDIGLYLHIISLDLRNNSLSNLPLELSSVKNLREIMLSCNRFQQLPPVLWELSKLEILFANDNKIRALDMDGLSRLKQLGTLDLQNNDIGAVPPQLGNMTWIKSLQLSGNAFRHPRPAILAKGTLTILSYLRDKIV